MKEHRGKCPNFPREKIHAGAVVRTQQDQAFYSCWFPPSPSPRKFGASLILVNSFFRPNFRGEGSEWGWELLAFSFFENLN